MRKLNAGDIVTLAEYERTREQSRPVMLAHRGVRRVLLGDKLVVTFETRETMAYQVHEMMRAEKMTAPEAVEREIGIYNELVPDRNQLTATVFVTVTTDADMREWLPRLVGVDEHLKLTFGGHTVSARSEPGRNRADKTASVHYIWFDFTEEQAIAFQSATDAALVCDHPNYQIPHALTRDSLLALRDDLGRE